MDTIIKERVRELRLAIGMTQSELAIRSGVDRLAIVRVETGRNQLTSYPLRAAMARGFGLSLDIFSALVDGTISVEQAIALRSGSGEHRAITTNTKAS